MLWLPFTTYYGDDPDFNEADQRAEVEQLFQRQSMIEDVWEGLESADTLLDLLEFQGIDPVEYVQTCVENVQLITGL
ncbi:MAG: hypothetical protein VKJ46_15990 [Leptolyngbyaceae bacterium]|nr:hypothetical protein [Leptolyngbyaceae bacterium]